MYFRNKMPPKRTRDNERQDLEYASFCKIANGPYTGRMCPKPSPTEDPSKWKPVFQIAFHLWQEEGSASVRMEELARTIVPADFFGTEFRVPPPENKWCPGTEPNDCVIHYATWSERTERVIQKLRSWTDDEREYMKRQADISKRVLSSLKHLAYAQDPRCGTDRLYRKEEYRLHFDLRSDVVHPHVGFLQVGIYANAEVYANGIHFIEYFTGIVRPHTYHLFEAVLDQNRMAWEAKARDGDVLAGAEVNRCVEALTRFRDLPEDDFPMRLRNIEVDRYLERLVCHDLAEAETPNGVQRPLHPHQRQTLQKMFDQEDQPLGLVHSFGWSPFCVSWTGVSWYLSKNFPGLMRPNLLEGGPAGGFVFDEVGLGKTLTTLALVLARPRDPVELAQAAPDLVKSRGTLVVCPASVIMQWKEQVDAHIAPNTLKVNAYQGTKREKEIARLADHDLVLTTFAHLRDPASLLHQIEWHRVVVDEAHVLNGGSNQAIRAIELAARNRWCLTGTPVRQRIEDMVYQMKFLKVPHINEYDILSNMPFALSWPVRHFEILHKFSVQGDVMPRISVRHTKAVIEAQLPALTIEDVAVEFSAGERQIYDPLAREMYQEFLRAKEEGRSILAALRPMRLLCAGGTFTAETLHLRGGKIRVGAAGAEPALAEDEECSICLDVLDEPVRTHCNHVFCKECILESLQRQKACPLCRAVLQENQLVYVGEPAGEVRTTGAKIEALLDQICTLPEGSKAIVFTEFTKTLEAVRIALAGSGVSYATLTGGMSVQERDREVRRFHREAACCVMILTHRAGSVGVNLTAADHVFFLEPMLSRAVETQAIGRAWRLGQQRPVIARRLYVRGSVEENVLAVRRRRDAIGQGDAQIDPVYYRGRRSMHAEQMKIREDEYEILFRLH